MALWPPPRAAEPTAARIRAVAWARIIIELTALAGSLTVLGLLRSASDCRPEMVRLATLVSVTALPAGVVLGLLFLRRAGRFYRVALYVCTLLDAVAAVVWIQLTGTVSSYYLAAG